MWPGGMLAANAKDGIKAQPAIKAEIRLGLMQPAVRRRRTSDQSFCP
jgi:hypothetical protein